MWADIRPLLSASPLHHQKQSKLTLSFLSNRNSKKSITSAMVFAAYCAGNMAGPQFIYANEKPRYQSGAYAMSESLLSFARLYPITDFFASFFFFFLFSFFLFSFYYSSGWVHCQARRSRYPLGYHVRLQQVSRPQPWRGRSQARRRCRYARQDGNRQGEPQLPIRTLSLSLHTKISSFSFPCFLSVSLACHY